MKTSFNRIVTGIMILLTLFICSPASSQPSPRVITVPAACVAAGVVIIVGGIAVVCFIRICNKLLKGPPPSTNTNSSEIPIGTFPIPKLTNSTFQTAGLATELMPGYYEEHDGVTNFSVILQGSWDLKQWHPMLVITGSMSQASSMAQLLTTNMVPIDKSIPLTSNGFIVDATKIDLQEYDRGFFRLAR